MSRASTRPVPCSCSAPSRPAERSVVCAIAHPAVRSVVSRAPSVRRSLPGSTPGSHGCLPGPPYDGPNRAAPAARHRAVPTAHEE